MCVFILNVSKTQGTAWYTKLKYGPMVEFGNLLNYTAMGVGNHDFDDSVEGFVPFAEQVVTCFCILFRKLSHEVIFVIHKQKNKSRFASVLIGLKNIKKKVLGQLSTPWSQHQLKSVQLHREQPLQQGGLL